MTPFAPRKRTNNCLGRTRILTDTPEKNKIEEDKRRKEEKETKKEEREMKKLLPRNILKPSVRKRKKIETCDEKENNVPNQININPQGTRAGRLVQRREITNL
jgi:hypothetical protein